MFFLAALSRSEDTFPNKALASAVFLAETSVKNFLIVFLRSFFIIRFLRCFFLSTRKLLTAALRLGIFVFLSFGYLVR